MLIECEKCGAPLDVQGNPSRVRCQYCAATTRLRKARTLSMQTPADWKPPEAWTPRAGGSLGAEPLPRKQVDPPEPRAGAVVAGVLLVLLVAIGGGVAWLSMEGSVPTTAGSTEASWDGLSTLHCGREPLVIVDRQVDLQELVVDATRSGCEVTFERCRISGPTIVQGGHQTKVRVVDSVLTATGTAMTGLTNMSLMVRGQSTVQGGDAAIAAGNNLRVKVERSSTILSESGDGIRGDVNMHVELDDATVRAAGVAIGADLNAEVEATRSRIVGGRAAFSFGDNPTLLLYETVVEGDRVLGANASINEAQPDMVFGEPDP